MTSNKGNLKENKEEIKAKDKSGKRARKQPPEVFYKKGVLKKHHKIDWKTLVSKSG